MVHHRKSLRWIKAVALSLLLVLALLAGSAIALRAYLMHVAEQRFTAVLTELDESEPGWRWDDLQARREVIPENENSAPIVLAAMKLVPRDWPQKPAAPNRKQQPQMEPPRSLPERLQEIEPVRTLDAEQAADLRAELVELAPALAEARRLIERRKGRYTVAWATDFLSTRLDHVQEARRCAYLLGLDAAARADDKDYDGALASTRGELNAGRSIGDEPTVISQLVRMACDAHAVVDMERVLAQGQVSQQALTSASALLSDEASQNLWLIAARGERAAALGGMRSLYTGQLDLEQFTLGRYVPSRWTNLSGWLYVRPVMHRGDSVALQYLTRLVHAAQSPADEQQKMVKAVEDEIRDIKAAKNYELVSVLLFVPHVASMAEDFDCHQARLRCAQVGMALERYRLANGHWPQTLNEIVPTLLVKIPQDPFASAPLRYRRLQDGVVVYSVGPDREDNGAILARQNSKIRKTDLGFRLWDSALRRAQLPAEKAQPAAEKSATGM